jgi:O-antigen/teichoic acid export membrane protein
LLVFMVVWLAGEPLLARVGLAAIADYMLLVPLAMLFAAARQIFEQLLIRRKRFRPIARVAVTQSLTLNSAKVGAGVFFPAGGVLVVLATAGQALHAWLLWLGLRGKAGSVVTPGAANSPVDAPAERPRAVRALAKAYRDFPLFRAPQMLINGMAQGLPVLMLASFSGPAAAGFYSLSKSVLAAPVLLIGKSVGDVFYPRIAEAAQRSEPVFPLLFKATAALAGVGCAPFILAVVFGPGLFAFVFGAEWVTAGEYARWLSLWLFFGFLNRPSVMTIQTLGLQGLFLVYEVVSVVLRVLALLVGFLVYSSDLVAVALFSLTGVLLNIVLIAVTLYKSAGSRSE